MSFLHGFVMVFLVREFKILPQQELHRSVWVYTRPQQAKIALRAKQTAWSSYGTDLVPARTWQVKGQQKVH